MCRDSVPVGSALPSAADWRRNAARRPRVATRQSRREPRTRPPLRTAALPASVLTPSSKSRAQTVERSGFTEHATLRAPRTDALGTVIPQRTFPGANCGGFSATAWLFRNLPILATANRPTSALNAPTERRGRATRITLVSVAGEKQPTERCSPATARHYVEPTNRRSRAAGFVEESGPFEGLQAAPASTSAWGAVRERLRESDFSLKDE